MSDLSDFDGHPFFEKWAKTTIDFHMMHTDYLKKIKANFWQRLFFGKEYIWVEVTSLISICQIGIPPFDNSDKRREEQVREELTKSHGADNFVILKLHYAKPDNTES